MADVGDAAVLYSDSPAVCMYEADEDYYTAPPCVDSSPLALVEAGAGFQTTADAWFVEVQQVRPCRALLRKASAVVHASRIAILTHVVVWHFSPPLVVLQDHQLTTVSSAASAPASAGTRGTSSTASSPSAAPVPDSDSTVQEIESP